MIQAVSKEQTILESLQTLSPQQQQSVLDFINFLQSQKQKIEYPTVEEQPISAYEAAKEWVGSVDSGIGDLSYNKKYLQGYSAQ